MSDSAPAPPVVRSLRIRRGPEIVIIAAVARKNRVIGSNQGLPWHIPEDLKRFKSLTLGHPIIMGRRTFDSLVEQFGGPLKGRRNIVVTSRPLIDPGEGVERYGSMSEALVSTESEKIVFIGGGAMVYEHFLDKSDRMELTLIDGDYEGDTFFPEYSHLVGALYEEASVDQRDGFAFVTYSRVTE